MLSIALKRTFQFIAKLILLVPVFSYAEQSSNDKGTPDLPALTWYTEQSPPYNFIANDVKQGIAIDILKEALNRSEVPFDTDSIIIKNWIDGYRQVQEPGQGNVIFSTARTEEREKSFKWVGPISTTRISVIVLKDSTAQLNQDSDYSLMRFVAIRDDIGEQLLKQKKADNIQSVTSVERAVNMLLLGKATAFAYEENVAMWLIKSYGYQPSDFKVIDILKEGEIYFAFNRDLDDKVVNEYQDIISKVTDDTWLMRRIFDRYVK